MLKVVQREKLLDLNLESGKVLLSGLKDLDNRFPGLTTSSRGIGTFCAVDCPSVQTRLE
jgi:4-aminobutyrate aminotransferase/(S)-3-amino-2-methylpropionate transaminase